jgi:hypothetical protein
MRKQRRQLGGEATVVVGKSGESPAATRGGVAMELEEVLAYRDLGLDLPCD